MIIDAIWRLFMSPEAKAINDIILLCGYGHDPRKMLETSVLEGKQTKYAKAFRAECRRRLSKNSDV
jgi:hypothetical protein